MRDVNAGPDVEVITTPQVIVGYQPTDEDLEIFNFMVDLCGDVEITGAFHALGRRIFGTKY